MVCKQLLQCDHEQAGMSVDHHCLPWESQHPHACGQLWISQFQESLRPNMDPWSAGQGQECPSSCQGAVCPEAAEEGGGSLRAHAACQGAVPGGLPPWQHPHSRGQRARCSQHEPSPAFCKACCIVKAGSTRSLLCVQLTLLPHLWTA